MSTTGESKNVKLRKGRLLLLIFLLIWWMLFYVWLIMIILGSVGAQTGWFVGPGFWTTWLISIAGRLITREHSYINENKFKVWLKDWLITHDE